MKRTPMVLLVAFASVVCVCAVQADAAQTRLGVTVEYVRYELSANGARRELGTQTSYISANGGWRTERRTPNGQIEQVLIGDASRAGVFLLSEGRAVRVSAFSASNSSHFNAEGYRNHPQFAEETMLLGFRAFVLRITSFDGRVESELTYIPEFDVLPVRKVDYEENGNRRITEPVSVTAGEPVSSQTQVPADTPVVDESDRRGMYF